MSDMTGLKTFVRSFTGRVTAETTRQLRGSELEKIGSIWKRWDLHLHAPGTKLSDSYGGASEENLKRYVDALEASDVQAFGITDYFSFNGYFTVLDAYGKHYPDGKKFFIPNIEFRLKETVSSDGRNVHTHVLIDPAAATPDKLATLLSDLYTHKTRNGVQLRLSIGLQI